MNRDDRALLAGLAMGAAVLLLALGLLLDWPVWLWLTLIVLLLAATGYAGRQISHRRHQELLQQQYQAQRPEPQAAPPDPERYTLSGIPLDSVLPGYPFLLSCVVCWHPLSEGPGLPHAAPHALAIRSVLTRAKEIAKAASPHDHALVQYQVAAALGAPQPDLSKQVLAWAEEVSLAMPDDAAEQLRRLSELRRQEQLWELERGHERKVRAYLEQEVLTSPGSAVVWWLARHLDDVEETVRLIGPLTLLSATANNTEVPPLFRHLLAGPSNEHLPPDSTGIGEPTNQLVPPSPEVAAHAARLQETNDTATHEPASALIRQLYPDAEQDAERALLGHQLASLLSHHGAQETAERIRREFDAPDLTLATEVAGTSEPAPPQSPHPLGWPEETPGNHTSGNDHVPNNNHVPDRALTGVAPDRNEGETTPEEGPERRSPGQTTAQ